MASPTTWEEITTAIDLLHREMVSPTAAAVTLGVSWHTVHRRVQRGQLRHIQLGRDVLVWRADLKTLS